MRRRGSLSAELRAARAEDLPLVSRLLSSAGLPTRGVAEHFGDFVVFFPRFGFERVPRSQVDPGVMASSEFKENCCQTAVSIKLHL